MDQEDYDEHAVWAAYTNKADVNFQLAREIINTHPFPPMTIWPVVWETVNLLLEGEGCRKGHFQSSAT